MRKQKMDQKLIDRAVKVAQQWNVFRPITEAGFSPTQIKEAIIGVLDQYFLNKDQLDEYAIELLSAEAFRVIRIKQDVWAEAAFNHIAGIYRAAEAVDAAACYKACAESERAVLAAASEHWSLLYLEIDKAELPLEEFRHEVFRNIGALIESFLFPHLRDLLVQARLTRGRMTAYDQIAKLKLGNVVNELHGTLGMPGLVAPPPWGIRLNQWRNIGQHHRSCIRGNLIYGYYGEPPNEQEVRFNRSELWDALRRIYFMCDAVSTARSLFVIDNIKAVHQYFPQDLALRGDTYILSLATALSTQGFGLADLQLSDDSVIATVVEMSEGPRNERMIHASQFVYPVWRNFERPTVVVRYVDKEGRLCLTIEAKGDDCKRIADGAIPFSALASLVTFKS
jgi:hypothetical protein